MSFLNTFQHAVDTAQKNHSIPLAIVGICLLVHVINVCCKYRLSCLGIIPRHGPSLLGVLTSPFLHGSFSHLLINMLMFFVLSLGVLTYGQALYFTASVLIMGISGLLLWLFGRPGVHIGASACVMGYFSFLAFGALLNPTFLSVTLSLLCLYFFGSLLGCCFPGKKNVSWEGHLFGCLAGVLSYWLISHRLVGALLSYFSR